MAKYLDSDGNDYDPEQTLRQRVLQQQTGSSDPTSGTSDAGTTSAAPIPPAPFDAAATNPETPIPMPPPPEAPAPAPAESAPPAAPAAPPASAGPIPTNPDGSQVGSGIPWAPGASQPSSAPPGYHWDANLAMFQPNAQASAAPSTDWIGQTLASVNSTDDPNYWRAKIAADPKVAAGDQSAINYWIDRIRRGDGSSLVANGTLQKFQDNPAPAAGASGAPRVASSINPTGSGGIGSIIPRTTTGATDGAPNGLWGPDFTAQIRQLLMQRLQAASQPVDPNSPQIAEPLTAARDQATRQTDQERTQLAEHLYAQGGLNTDAIGQQIQQSNERNAVGLGTLRGNLISKEIESRKTDLRDLMQMALASGDAEAAREIQLQITELNAMLQRENMGVNLAINESNQNANTVNSGGF